ncbi:NLPC-P60 domain-containing protein [Mycena venus]|uniref:NLPC-P60 domain-containing protein n=1 Tax=Mycena venus TaxID=2733690 RepID=A0A8H6XP59_9AGAR|nr:NLPC-P60 domain-containing protein [Mycena venus]
MASAQTVLNGPCKGGDLAPGVGACVHTSTCNAHHGTIIKNLCPGTDDDVHCCTDWDAPKCQARSGTHNPLDLLPINYLIVLRFMPWA